MTAAPITVALSLVSHTNVGKTTLARTLLQRDIGEVRDEAHVTMEAERDTLIESPEGDRLELWDTPGFGDSTRLAKRLAQAGNPLGWFMSEVWDRFRDRAFWSSQRAVRNILDQADVVLYLVNASESPDDAGYIDAEFSVLDLIGKPVIVLLNQLGPPRAAADEAAELQRWRERLQAARTVRDVIALDAFARCWVQEGTLLETVAQVLPADRQTPFARLQQAWQTRARETWHSAMRVLAERLAAAAADRETVPDAGWPGRIKEAGAALGLRRESTRTPTDEAMAQLAARLQANVRGSTDRLIKLHGLGGSAADEVLARLAEHYAVREPLDEGKAAAIGGIVTGALTGLKADIATGGLTLGGGMLAGSILGALGALGVARGVNTVRGIDARTVAWTDAVLDDLLRSSLLGYLAVAHYGRGRGDWVVSENPQLWAALVDVLMNETATQRANLWARRGGGMNAFTRSLEERLTQWTGELLRRLYPEARAALH